MNTTRNLRRPLALLTAAGLATAGLAVAGPAQAAEIDLNARMHGMARGHAEYESDHEGREFDIHIAGVKSLAGKRVAVRVHGDLVGKMTVGHRGRAHLERHRGVPKMAAGNVVRVRTPSGNLVTSGTLHRDTND